MIVTFDTQQFQLHSTKIKGVANIAFIALMRMLLSPPQNSYKLANYELFETFKVYWEVF